MKKALIRTSVAIGAAAAAALLLLFAGILPLRAYIVNSDSMNNRGALVIDHVGHYHPGQAVTFYGPHGERVTHKLLGFRPDGTANTKGTANKTPDPGHAPRSAIIGGVVLTIPFIGGVITFLGTPTGIGVMITILVVAVFVGARSKPKPTAAASATA